MSEDIEESEVKLGEDVKWFVDKFEESFRVTIKIEDFRELIHAIEYTSTDKEYIKRFPIHAMKQCEIIPIMQSLLNRVQKAIDMKKIAIQKEDMRIRGLLAEEATMKRRDELL